MKLFFVFLLATAHFILVGCNANQNTSTGEPERQDTTNSSAVLPANQVSSLPDSISENVKKVRDFLALDYLAEDLPYLEDSDRKFQLYFTDLNGDSQDEIFVRFLSPYFCGSGGCTFLILSPDMKLITRLTVTRAPIFVEKTKENGWSVLLVKDNGVFKELTYENGSYPANPSVLPKAPYDAPSGHAEVLFDERFSPPKTFTF
jgi:hypothetical protein